MRRERNLAEVIDRMLAVVPSDQPGFRLGLEWEKDSLLYTAPECIGHRWHQVGAVINACLPLPDQLNHWQAKLVAIWTDTEGA